MAKTTLSVKVFGGVPPFSIKVILFKGDETIKEFEKPNNFDFVFKELKGSYTLMISGPNPMSDQRRTVISVDETEIKLSKDSDPNPAVRVGKSYMIQYSFNA
jgi:hypothetical protein